MSIIYNKNFVGRRTPGTRFIADTYVRCNFSQPNAILDPDTGNPTGVPIFPGSRNTPRQFIECNLVNCDVPPNSLVVDCNTSIHSNIRDMEDIKIRGTKVRRVRKQRRVVNGRYVHHEDGTRTYEEFDPEGTEDL